jgi:hypothetical protein
MQIGTEGRLAPGGTGFDSAIREVRILPPQQSSTHPA